MIRVAIVDDYTMFVDGIESILSHEKDIKLVAKCYSGKELLDILMTSEFDVLLLDINLPDMSGIEICKTIYNQNLNINILALSMYNEKSFVTEILKMGQKVISLKTLAA